MKFFNVDILDSEGPDLELDIPKGKVIKKNYDLSLPIIKLKTLGAV